MLPNAVDPDTGESGVNGSFNWNDCRSDAGAVATSADDVGFIGALINWMDENRNIDLQRVYVVGGSNGGMMAYRLAFELSDRVSAVAAVIANLPGNSECEPQPAHPISVLLMNGTLDIFIPFAGGQVLGNRGLVLSADATREFFTNFLGTDADPEHVDFPDLDPTDAGDVGRDTYRGGMEGNEVVFYRANGAGHNFPSIAHPLGPGGEAIFGEQNHDIESAVEIWSFFRAENSSRSRFPRRAPGALHSSRPCSWPSALPPWAYGSGLARHATSPSGIRALTCPGGGRDFEPPPRASAAAFSPWWDP